MADFDFDFATSQSPHVDSECNTIFPHSHPHHGTLSTWWLVAFHRLSESTRPVHGAGKKSNYDELEAVRSTYVLAYRTAGHGMTAALSGPLSIPIAVLAVSTRYPLLRFDMIMMRGAPGGVLASGS